MRFCKPDIKRLEEENNIPELLKCLDHKKAYIRYRAFVALSHGREIGDDVTAKLKRMVHDPDPWVRSLAVLRFAELGDQTVSESLLEIMDEGSVRDRIDLLKIITGRGATGDATVLQVIVIALGDKKEVVRIFAIKAAAAAGNRHLMQYLSESLHEKHHKVRILAADALYAIGREESADYLIGLLADSNPEVQAAARSYLSSVNTEYVQKALHDSEFKRLVAGICGREPEREKTARLIGADKIREGLPLLHRACRDRYRGVRVECLRAMAQFKDASSVEFAERLLGDRYHEVRIEAVNTLGAVGGKRALKSIGTMLNDRHRGVREAAEKLLGVKREA